VHTFNLARLAAVRGLLAPAAAQHRRLQLLAAGSMPAGRGGCGGCGLRGSGHCNFGFLESDSESSYVKYAGVYFRRISAPRQKHRGGCGL